MKVITVILFAISFAGCTFKGSVTEPSGCAPARERVREFFSIHIDSLARGNKKLSDKEKDFLSPELANEAGDYTGTGDFFTKSKIVPNTFRIGSCTKTKNGFDLQVLLFWKTDTTKDQRNFKAGTQMADGNWKIFSYNPES
ncbi:MAG: hypothetical protein ACK5NT_08615 [Pyrinomonadaceae bacterium]